MATRSKARKAATRKYVARKMNPELQRKIAKIACEMEIVLINLRVQANKIDDEGDVEHGTPADIVRLLAREAVRQLDGLRALAGDY